ncbi:hypothetical protein, partial [Edaphobacter aggregans]|uniref:hypothetical protein n=1 Tax=Edaphobacter aggregans TaxID=570835 RepID=UPI001B80BC81
ERAVFPRGRDGGMLHRRFFELCVFHQIMRELNSGDLYVKGSDRFDDFRVHQVSAEEFQRELSRYSEIVGLPVDGKTFAKELRQRLGAALDEVDANFPENDSIEFGEQGLIIHKPGKEPEPPNKAELIFGAQPFRKQERGAFCLHPAPGLAPEMVLDSVSSPNSRRNSNPFE